MRIASLFYYMNLLLIPAYLFHSFHRPQLLDKRFQPSRITDHNRQCS